MTCDVPERIGLIADGLGLWALAEKHEAGIATHYVRDDIARAEMEAAVLAEREACAKIAEEHYDRKDRKDWTRDPNIHGLQVAAEIRERKP